jgi:hypothetical protein
MSLGLPFFSRVEFLHFTLKRQNAQFQSSPRLSSISILCYTQFSGHIALNNSSHLDFGCVHISSHSLRKFVAQCYRFMLRVQHR